MDPIALPSFQELAGWAEQACAFPPRITAIAGYRGGQDYNDWLLVVSRHCSSHEAGKFLLISSRRRLLGQRASRISTHRTDTDGFHCRLQSHFD